ncbi:DUF1707 SHOCT-like domain-containing protein [Actinopolymorpha alba]|uniref:DUF1707 SHOCT-like domain-containing protein n=1 Tax=Actinopolymorpha alba TaxID=533267 RepID=UPI00035E7DD0|nr:DUF1707 domain-containing protein [Actinopolymorpha alba]
MESGGWPAAGSGDLRASDADRDHTAEILREAAAEGRIDLGELEVRLERTFAAKTYAELAPLTADLPLGDGADSRSPAARPGSGYHPLTQPGPNEINAVLSEQNVTGRWLVPRRLTARALIGQVTLDLTEADIPHEVILDVQVGLGQLTLIVPDDIAVEFEHGTTVLGERKNKSHGRPGPGTPLIRVRGIVIVGELIARPPKRRRWFKRAGG